jgi:LPS-assembly protein
VSDLAGDVVIAAIPRKTVLGVGTLVSRGALLICVSVAAMLVAAPISQAIVKKEFVKPILKKPIAGTRVDVVADRITFEGRSKIATATGMVRITYGPYVLVATKVVYEQDGDSFKANGSVELREPNGNILQAETADLHNKFKEGFAKHLRLLLTNDVTITAEYARRQEGGITIYERASYTACKDCSTDGGAPVWEITTTKTIHDEKAKNLYHTNPTLKIGGVPVAWLPYVEMPDPTVKRRTGFLLPSFHSGNTYGFGVTTPYFWELGPSADLTFRPMWTTKQGPVADVEFRQRLNSGRYRVHGYGVYQLTEPDPPGDTKWRGAVTTDGRFTLNETWDWGWDGTLTSDKTFLDKYDFDERDLATSKLYLTGMDDRNYFSAEALHFRTLSVEEDQDDFPLVLPYINSEYTLDQAVLGGELSFDFSAYSLSRDDPGTPYETINHGTDQTRAVANVNWQRQMTTGAGQVITPFAKMRSDLYITNNLPDGGGGFQDEEVTGRILPSAGIDVRWPFIASYDFGQSILTPVFQAIAATNETDEDKIGNEDAISVNFDSSSLFLHDRFTGYDRYEGGTRANVGLLYSFLADNGGSVRMSLGESFHIAGENSFDLGSGLEGSESDLVGAILLQPWDNLGLSYQARVEEDLSSINVQEAFANFTVDRFSTSLGYIYLDSEPSAGREETTEQIESDASFRFTEAWSLFGGLRYDLDDDKFRSKSVGIAFDCDCMSAKLTYSETNKEDSDEETESMLKLSVELRTIGRTGFSFGL